MAIELRRRLGGIKMPQFAKTYCEKAIELQSFRCRKPSTASLILQGGDVYIRTDYGASNPG